MNIEPNYHLAKYGQKERVAHIKTIKPQQVRYYYEGMRLNLPQTARRLKISRPTLRKLMIRFKIKSRSGREGHRLWLRRKA